MIQALNIDRMITLLLTVLLSQAAMAGSFSNPDGVYPLERGQKHSFELGVTSDEMNRVDHFATRPAPVVAQWPAVAPAVEARHKLLHLALRYHNQPWIPYIWGGNEIGNRWACEQCRACVERHESVDLKKRRDVCKACQRCGVDCSNFVHYLYNAVGLNYPIATTKELTNLKSQDLLERYNLVTIGRNMRHAEPGDLLLHDKHIVMLLRRRPGNRGDFIHASKLGDPLNLGGIQVAYDVEIPSYRGGLKKILRHRELYGRERTPDGLRLSPPPGAISQTANKEAPNPG